MRDANLGRLMIVGVLVAMGVFVTAFSTWVNTRKILFYQQAQVNTRLQAQAVNEAMASAGQTRDALRGLTTQIKSLGDKVTKLENTQRGLAERVNRLRSGQSRLNRGVKQLYGGYGMPK